jgi:hypothetical protein
MTDRSAQIAEYLMASCGVPDAARQAELIRRFPRLVPDELRRGVEIAQELLRAKAAECFAEAEALRGAGRSRRSAPDHSAPATFDGQ